MSIVAQIAGLFVLVRKLYNEKAINLAQKGILKDHIIAYNSEILEAFKVFVEKNDKNTLVDTLLSVLAREESGLISEIVEKKDSFPLEKKMILNLQSSLNRLKLYKLSIREIWDAFEHGSGIEKSDTSIGLTKKSYQHFTSSIIVKHNDPHFIKEFFDYLYDVLDIKNNGIVDFEDILCAITMLSSANEAQKIMFSFELMDINSNGYISPQDLFRIVYATCAVLSSLDPGMNDVNESKQISYSRAIKYFNSSGLSQNDQIYFENLSKWEFNPAAFFEFLLTYEGKEHID